MVRVVVEIDKKIPGVTSHKVFLPPWIPCSVSFLMKKLKALRKMSQNLRRLLKMNGWKKIETKKVKALASIEENVYKYRQFSQAQKYKNT